MNSAVIDPKELARAIRQMSLWVDPGDTSRPILQNILLRIESGMITLIATHGFGLATTSLRISILSSGLWGIPYTSAQELLKKLKKAKEARLRVEGGELILEAEGKRTICSHQQLFLDWTRLIPSSFLTEATFPSREMGTALKELAKGKRDVPIILNVDAKNGEIAFLLREEQVEEPGEERRASVKAEVKGPSTKEAFALRYLRQIVETFSGEITLKTIGYARIRLHLQDPRPLASMFKDEETKVIIMPMVVPIPIDDI